MKKINLIILLWIVSLTTGIISSIIPQPDLYPGFLCFVFTCISTIVTVGLIIDSWDNLK